MAATTAPRLALDLGNTATKAAVFQEGKIGKTFLLASPGDWRKADERVTNLGVRHIVFSTVANEPPPRWIDKWNDEGRRVLSLDDGLPLPFRSRYQTMATLGRDRIAAVAGGLALRAGLAPAFAGEPDPAPASTPDLLIVDAGTCVTMDLLDGYDVYHGGNISPGLRMRLRAMSEFTARLPAPAPARPSGPVGNSTAEALRHGAQLGLVYEIEGLYARLKTTRPGLALYLTGGDGPYLSGQLSVPHVFNPDLVLLGLHHILSNYVLNES